MTSTPKKAVAKKAPRAPKRAPSEETTPAEDAQAGSSEHGSKIREARRANAANINETMGAIKEMGYTLDVSRVTRFGEDSRSGFTISFMEGSMEVVSQAELRLALTAMYTALAEISG